MRRSCAPVRSSAWCGFHDRIATLLVGCCAFFLPSLLILADKLLAPRHQLPGSFLYLVLIVSALTCCVLLGRLPLGMPSRIGLIIAALALLMIQMFALGVFLIGADGLSGTQ